MDSYCPQARVRHDRLSHHHALLLLLLVAQLCPTLCDPVDYSMPGFPVLHHLWELAQTHFHWIKRCHPTISSSVVPFSSCFQSFPASETFLMYQLFISDGQRTGASASVLPMNIQGWLPLVLTGLISLQSKGCSRVFSNTIVKKHQFFNTQSSLFIIMILLQITIHAIHPGIVEWRFTH